MLWGGLAGIMVSVLATFVAALLYGQAQGMDPGSCVVFGCMFPLILSQVTGIPGMLVGALVGGLGGALAHRFQAPTAA